MISQTALRDFDGFLLWKDVVLLDFCVKDSRVISWNQVEGVERFYPIEFKSNCSLPLQAVDQTTVNAQRGAMQLSPGSEVRSNLSFGIRELNAFLDNRMLPTTRQGLDRVLQDLKLVKYSWEGILEANYGLCTDDCYWFRERDSYLVYEDIKIRD